MSFWEHGEQEKQKQLSQPNKFFVFFVFKNKKHINILSIKICFIKKSTINKNLFIKKSIKI